MKEEKEQTKTKKVLPQEPRKKVVGFLEGGPEHQAPRPNPGLHSHPTLVGTALRYLPASPQTGWEFTGGRNLNPQSLRLFTKYPHSRT